MRAIIYRRTGGADVLELTERPAPTPGPGEVVVRVAVSGVNPTDCKSRQGSRPGQELAFPAQVPNQDGSGTVVDVGHGVDRHRIGQRVWIWEAAWQRAEGTGQELVALPEQHAVPLPEAASFDLGAGLGIPALTAHRALTVGDGGPSRLHPGALEGRTVLVAGGAGAVGHAAIELAKWAGARVIATVSSPAKELLAAAAGADLVVNYRDPDAASVIRSVVVDGVDLVVEVAAAANAGLDLAVAGPDATVACYANDADEVAIPIRQAMTINLRYQFLLVYTVPHAAKGHAVADISAAVADGALRIGEAVGLPVHRFPLERMADAHRAVEDGATGKVLVDVGS